MRASAVRMHLEGWSVEIPESWEHSFEDGVLVMAHGNGARLNVSSISKTDDGEAADSDLVEFIEEMGMGTWHRIEAGCGPFTGYHLYGDDDEGHLREYWFLRAGILILFVEYSPAAAEDSGEEDDVAEALASLRSEPSLASH